MLPASSTCCYRVDSADRLVWLDEQWLAFARENCGVELLAKEKVIGRPLWEFIAGEATRGVYQQIHEHVRSSGRDVVFPVRCDSPRMRRQIWLTISREDDGELFYESKLLWARPQGPLDLLDTAVAHSEESVTMCSCCKRGFTEAGGWEDISDFSVRLHLFRKPRVPRLNYTVCPDCEAAAATASQ